MNFEAASREFFRYLEYERGCTAATSRAYGADLRRCVAFLEDVGIPAEVEQVTRVVVREYLAWMGEKGYRPSTVRRRIAALSSLCKYLVSAEKLGSNPCVGLALPKKRRRLPAVLSVEEAKRFLSASEDHPNVRMGFRNRAIIGVLLYCGLRRSEVLALKVNDVDLKAGWLKVCSGKGMKDRLIPLLPEVSGMVEDWLEFRPEVGHGALFTGREGKPLALNTLVRLFDRVRQRAGLDREGVTLHTLRHTFASLLLQEGCDLVSIRDMLGHADLATTSIYLQVSASHLQAAVERHPMHCQRGLC
jgi:site-specific recombinase XerD